MFFVNEKSSLRHHDETLVVGVIQTCACSTESMRMTGNLSICQNYSLFCAHLMLDGTGWKLRNPKEKDVALSVLHSHCRHPQKKNFFVSQNLESVCFG